MSASLEVPIAGSSYHIHIGQHLLTDPLFWQRLLSDRQAFLLSDTNVAPHFLQKLLQSLGERDVSHYLLPAGEHNKSLEQFSVIMDHMIRHKLRRNSVVLALGGGVVGDIGGFAAASYQRGVPIIQIPTSLLAMVDSSVGGKTAVNHPAGKNMIGAFWQPEAVVIDIEVLKTLPQREYHSGMAEVIKYAFIRDIEFLPWLEQNALALSRRDSAVLENAIYRSCKNKADIVVADPSEKGIRALLNLGHTFAHAIETELGYGKWLHGEAVAAGMVLAFRLAERLGRLPSDHFRKRLENLLETFSLPLALPQGISTQNLLHHMMLDKKNLSQTIRFVLPDEQGKSEIFDAVPENMVLSVLNA